jgi:hypothetical protein
MQIRRRLRRDAGGFVLPNPNPKVWFNPKAIVNNTNGTFGDCARDNLRGPRQVNIDFPVIEDFRIREAVTAGVTTGRGSKPIYPLIDRPQALIDTAVGCRIR